MEEYLQNMKTLRSQMNDVEDQAAKISVEEQTQITSIHTMEMDLDSGFLYLLAGLFTATKSETRHLKEEAERMVKENGQICSQILEKQKKIASLAVDSSTLSQTLELLQQEKVSLSAKLSEKRAFYDKVMHDMHVKLQEQQDFINSHNPTTEFEELRLVEGRIDEQKVKIGGSSTNEIHPITNTMGHETNKNDKDLMTKLESAKAKLEEVTANKSKLVLEHSKMVQSVEQLKHRTVEFPPELRAMDIDALEEEHKALLADKAGEMEYLQSLQHQIEKLKGISHVIKCACGEQYEVEMETCA